MLGQHPSGGDIVLREGRFGPYVSLGKINATLKNGVAADSITLEDAIQLIDAKGGVPSKKKSAAKAGPAKAKPAKTTAKTAPKKAAAKKTATQGARTEGEESVIKKAGPAKAGPPDAKAERAQRRSALAGGDSRLHRPRTTKQPHQNWQAGNRPRLLDHRGRIA